MGNKDIEKSTNKFVNVIRCILAIPVGLIAVLVVGFIANIFNVLLVIPIDETFWYGYIISGFAAGGASFLLTSAIAPESKRNVLLISTLILLIIIGGYDTYQIITLREDPLAKIWLNVGIIGSFAFMAKENLKSLK